MFFATALVGWVAWHGLSSFGSFVAAWAGADTAFAGSVAFQLSTTFAALGILALALDNGAAAKAVATACGDLIEVLLQDALENRYCVELTMENQKVYIGRPRRSGVTTSSESDISIVPIMSGYRDAERQLQITTFYTAALKRFAGHASSLSPEDFQVLLPKRPNTLRQTV